MVNRRSPSAVTAEIAAVLAHLEVAGSAATIRRIAPTAARLGRFLEQSGVHSLSEVDSERVDAFVRSRLGSGLPASVGTMHDRRCTLRLVFRAGRRIELLDHDPTVDVELPRRATRSARPLTDVEVDLARDVALWSLSSRRVAATWALAEATGRGAELAVVSVADLDIDGGRVWLSGGARTLPRWGDLTEWGVRVLRGRIDELGVDSRLAYTGEGRGIAGQVSTCHAISTVLVRAGLAKEADLRPLSVTGWAGRRVYEATGDITACARALGVRSLDQAATLIGLDWKQTT